MPDIGHSRDDMRDHSAIEMQQPTMPIDSVTIQTIGATPPVFIGSSSAASSATAAVGFGTPGRSINLCWKRKIRLSEHRAHEQDTEQEIR